MVGAVGGRLGDPRALAADDARQHPRRRRAPARRLDPRGRLDPARERTQGKVKRIRWRHTVVETRDWDTIIVPNAALLAGKSSSSASATGSRAAPPHVGLLQRRLPLRAVTRDRGRERGAAARADRGRRRGSEAELHLHGLRERQARQLRLLRRALLAHRSRGRRPDELGGARAHLRGAPARGHPARDARARDVLRAGRRARGAREARRATASAASRRCDRSRSSSRSPTRRSRRSSTTCATRRSRRARR